MSLYAVMGNPIDHSLSPTLYHAFAKQIGVEISCEKIRVPDGEFNAVMQQFIARGGRGTGITLPLKEIAYRFARHHSVYAAQAKAASMLHINDQQEIVAYNFDGIGLVNDLKKNHQVDFKKSSILICGAGGAVRGVLPIILNEKPRCLHIVNRTFDKAKKLLDDDSSMQAYSYDELTQSYDVIINGTSSSVQQLALPLPACVIQKNTLCYDMMYARERTAFLNFSHALGATHLSDGRGMLVEHCACAFEVWFKVMPNTETVLAQFYK